jgi:hypothetical protein
MQSGTCAAPSPSAAGQASAGTRAFTAPACAAPCCACLRRASTECCRRAIIASLALSIDAARSKHFRLGWLGRALWWSPWAAAPQGIGDGGWHVRAASPPLPSCCVQVAYSTEVCALLDLDPAECERPEFALVFGGAAPLPGGYERRRTWDPRGQGSGRATAAQVCQLGGRQREGQRAVAVDTNAAMSARVGTRHAARACVMRGSSHSDHWGARR